MNNYRNLTEKEIATLVVYGCSADDWKNILVATDFSPKFISNVSFWPGPVGHIRKSIRDGRRF